MTPQNKIQKLGGIQRPLTPQASFTEPSKLEVMRLNPDELDDVDKVQLVNSSAMDDTREVEGPMPILPIREADGTDNIYKDEVDDLPIIQIMSDPDPAKIEPVRFDTEESTPGGAGSYDRIITRQKSSPTPRHKSKVTEWIKQRQQRILEEKKALEAEEEARAALKSTKFEEQVPKIEEAEADDAEENLADEATDDGPSRRSYSIPSKPVVMSSEGESAKKVDNKE